MITENNTHAYYTYHMRTRKIATMLRYNCKIDSGDDVGESSTNGDKRIGLNILPHCARNNVRGEFYSARKIGGTISGGTRAACDA